MIRDDMSLLLPPPQHVDTNAGALCLAFLNSTQNPGGSSIHDDLQPGYANVLSWAWDMNVVNDETARRLLAIARRHPREASTVRRRIIEFRSTLHRLISTIVAAEEPDPDDLVLLERELRGVYAHACISRDPETHHLIWVWPEGAHLECIMGEIVRSAEAVFFSNRTDRIRRCNGEGCQKVFLDMSKNRSRRYCSTGGCGNRERVRRHRRDTSS